MRITQRRWFDSRSRQKSFLYFKVQHVLHVVQNAYGISYAILGHACTRDSFIFCDSFQVIKESRLYKYLVAFWAMWTEAVHGIHETGWQVGPHCEKD